MAHRVVILGGGTGGTLLANRLRTRLRAPRGCDHGRRPGRPPHLPARAGHFPTTVGLPLLKNSRLSHLAKVEFQWLYWHVLLPGRDIPGLGSAMPTSGKAGVEAAAADASTPAA